MGRIFFVRHGQTDWNLELRLQGQKQISLNETGRKEASEAGKELKRRLKDADLSEWHLVCSDNARAKETAEIVRLEVGLEKKQESPLLQERGSGSWEGTLLADVIKQYGWKNLEEPKFCTLLDKITEVTGESKALYLERIKQCCAFLQDLSLQKKNLIIVSHGLTLRALVAMLCFHKDFRQVKHVDFDWPQFDLKNASISEARTVDSAFFLVSLNDLHHITDGKKTPDRYNIFREEDKSNSAL
jgi:probable phosphoglycerate mutase